jgi:hypothetical protein
MQNLQIILAWMASFTPIQNIILQSIPERLTPVVAAAVMVEVVEVVVTDLDVRQAG